MLENFPSGSVFLAGDQPTLLFTDHSPPLTFTISTRSHSSYHESLHYNTSLGLTLFMKELIICIDKVRIDAFLLYV